MIRVKIVRGLDLASDNALLYLTLSLGGLSKTSRVTGKESPDDEVAEPEGNPSPSIKEGNSAVNNPPKRDASLRMKQLGWVWDEELDLMLPADEKRGSVAEIKVSCFDSEFRPCGKVHIPVSRLAPNQSVQQWYPLEDTNPKAALLLRLTLIPEIPESSSISPAIRPLTSNSPPLSISPTVDVPSTTENLDNDSKSLIDSLPMGIADYFIVAGCSPETARQERAKLLAKPRKKPHGFSHSNPVDELSQASVIGPDSVTLSPVMLDRYPKVDRQDVEFPTKPEMFLLPDGAEITRAIPKNYRVPRFFTFVLVTNGMRTYGHCLEMFEPLAKREDIADVEELFSPIVICYLTRIPVPDTTFRWVLQKTYESRKRRWLERIVETIVLSVPPPLPGILETKLNLISDDEITLRLPTPSELLPLVFPGMCKHVFEWFPLDAIIDLWIGVLTEQKILIHSKNREVLSIIAETMIQLMYPFKWENAFVPILPTSLMQLFDAPIPCILGLRTDALKLIPGGGLDALSDEWIIVDADKCVIMFPKAEPIPGLPVELRSRLYRTIRSIKVDGTLKHDERDRLVRLAFLECLVSLLQGYRESFFVLSTDADASTVFNRSQFFQRQASQRLQQQAHVTTSFQLLNSTPTNDTGRSFLERFFDTTAFERFKVSQYDPETDFFHSVYALRRARERERDQRAAALAALQGEAESTPLTSSSDAISNQLSSTVPGTVNIRVASSVTKIWNARDWRWNPQGLQPIDPFCSKTDITDNRKIISVRARAPILLGEKVECKPFGVGTVFNADIDSSSIVICVDLEWGAKGYFQANRVSRLTSGDSNSAADGQNTSLISHSSSAYSLSSLEEEEGPKTIPIVAVESNYSNNVPNSLPQTAKQALQKVDEDDIKKSITHFYRIRGEVGPPSASSGSNSYPKRNASKSVTDARMERVIHRAIINVFQDKAIPDTDLQECAEYLSSSQLARNMLVYVLKSQQSNHLTADSSWLATPGRGRRLGLDAFLSLYELFDSLLRACATKEDFSNGRCALEVSQFYYHDDETLQNKLRGHTLWSKPMFWEYAFAEQFAMSLDPTASKALPEVPTVSSDAVIESPSVALARFHQIGNQCDPDNREEHKQKLFEHLSFFLHTMLNLDVLEEMARLFVDRVASVYNLEEDQKVILNTLITNISRAASYHIEEERAQAALTEGSQPGSPTSSSRKQSRKHYSVEAISSSMVARLSGWRRTSASKARSPNSGSGRRDSQASQDTGYFS